MAITTYFGWTCPACGLSQIEEVDAELGPFCTVICESCQEAFEYHSLSPEDVLAWDRALDELGEQG
jgi:hypothetical protein